MKVYEVFTMAKPLIEKLTSSGINPKDIQYMDLYDDFLRLKNEGHKVTYIEAYLCEEYGIKKTKFYELTKLFDIDL